MVTNVVVRFISIIFAITYIVLLAELQKECPNGCKEDLSWVDNITIAYLCVYWGCSLLDFEMTYSEPFCGWQGVRIFFAIPSTTFFIISLTSQQHPGTLVISAGFFLALEVLSFCMALKYDYPVPMINESEMINEVILKCEV